MERKGVRVGARVTATPKRFFQNSPANLSVFESQIAIIDVMSEKRISCATIQVSTFRSRLVTVQRTKMIDVNTDDGQCVGSPELRLVTRDELTVTSGLGKGTHSRFSESKPQRNQWSEERRLGARTQGRGVQQEWCELGERTMRLTPVAQESDVGVVAVVVTRKAETRNASSGPVKHDCSRSGAV